MPVRSKCEQNPASCPYRCGFWGCRQGGCYGFMHAIPTFAGVLATRMLKISGAKRSRAVVGKRDEIGK
jgi:hypothetical protein